MDISVRRGAPGDAETCGEICYQAFSTIATHHNFPPDFPSAEVACGLFSVLLNHPGFYSVIAEVDGRVVGSNFLDERNPIAGVGPITIDPAVQNKKVGRRLMEDVLKRASKKGFAGVRLFQATYHSRSLSLYAKLGFEIRELISTMQGTPPKVKIPGITVRPARDEDIEACNQLCRRVHGHDRAGELEDTIRQGTATVAERDGRVTGYMTAPAFFGHSVAETNDDLKALIAAAEEFHGPGIQVPARNGELFRWCMGHGLRVVQPMTLMTIGLYNEPTGAYLPSVLY